MAQENKIAFDKYTLDNGLTVILHQDKKYPDRGNIAVMYHVGQK